MSSDDLTFIGTINKAKGLKGEVKVNFEGISAAQIQSNAVLFIDTDPRPIPYFIQAISLTVGSYAIIKFESIDSKEAAQKISGKRIFVKGKIENASEEEVGKHIIGFEVIDNGKVTIGRIKDVLDMPMQKLLQINYKGKEIMIPINDETFISIDTNNRKIILNIPEGLLDLYA